MKDQVKHPDRSQILAAQQLNEEKDFWITKLSEIPDLSGNMPGNHFPYNSSRSYNREKHLESCPILIDKELCHRLMTVSNRSDNRLYMVLTAALTLLLYRYTGSRFILLGAPVMIQTGEKSMVDWEGYTNTAIVLSLEVTPDMTFKELILHTRSTLADAVRNQAYPIEVLAQQLNLTSQYKRFPLFDTVVMMNNIQRRQGMERFLPGMIFTFTREQETISALLEYQPDIYTSALAEQVARHFKVGLAQAMQRMDEPLSKLDILNEEEKKQLLREFNPIPQPIPQDQTIHALFEDQVERSPGAIALTGRDLDGNAIQWSYKYLNRRVNILSQYLIEKKQVTPGERVGLLLDRSLDMIAAILAVLKAGAAYVPFDPSFPGRRLKMMIQDAGVGVVLSQKRFIKILNQLQWECPTFHTFMCLDSRDIDNEEEVEKSQLMGKNLWEYVGEKAEDDITGGGWLSSYTGKPISAEEMAEYGDNVLEKLRPLLKSDMKVLEVGCASGLTMYRIAPLVGKYVGTDLSSVIISKNRQRVDKEGIDNIQLYCLAAHEIHNLDDRDFDLVIINSVIQCFHGHNYLRRLFRNLLEMMANDRPSYLFIGDIMDLDLKDDMIRDLKQFKQINRDKGYTTKTDWSTELFLSRDFFKDVAARHPSMQSVNFSGKRCTIENELTRYRFDALISVDKRKIDLPSKNKVFLKFREDRRILETCSENNPSRRGHKDSLSYIIYTSGSSGTPKGILTTHGNVIRVTVDTNYIEITPKDRLLQLSNYAFDGSVFDIYAALLNGAALAIPDKNETMEMDRVAEMILDKKVTVFFVTTAYFNTMVDYRLEHLSHVRKILFGGERVSVEHVEKALAYLGQGRLLHVYGPTETTVFASFYPIDEIDDKLSTIPIGRPVSNTYVYILNAQSMLMPQGAAGEICIAGAGVAIGYLNRPDLTKKVFLRNPFESDQLLYRTGDLGRQLPTGDILFEGRIDQQVKIRGFRIEPGEIESQLNQMEGIREAVVLVRENQLAERFLVAYVVGLAANKELDATTLKEELSHYMPDFMVPGHIITLESMPLTPNGKIDRSRLPAPVLSSEKEGFVAPENHVQEVLALIWANILGLEKNRISIDDDFFQLGGHSLKATVVVSRIQKELHVKVPLAEMFRVPTIRDLATFIGQLEEQRYTSIEAVEKKEYYPVSSAQKRMYILQQMDPGNIGYNETSAVILEGDLDSNRLETSLNALIHRHETLRTSFIMLEDEPFQIVHKTEDIIFEFQRFDLSGYDETNIDKQMAGIFLSFIQPFKMDSAPLIRTGLVKQSDSRFIFILDMHHIITDGTSMQLLAREMMGLYDGNTLPPLKLQYKDFSQWQNRSLAGSIRSRQEDYWLAQFKEAAPRLNLPIDYSRPRIRTFEGDRFEFQLDETQTRALNQLARRENVTLYMVTIAVYAVLLARISGQDDIVVGSVIAGRRHADLQNIIGMFVNTLANRFYPTPTKTFKNFLVDVRENALKAFENQEYQFEDLVDALGVERDMSHNPLFSAAFGFHNMVVESGHIEEVDTADIRMLPYRNRQRRTSKFDMTLHGREVEKKVRFAFEYSIRLFKPKTILRFSDYYKNIISSVIKDIHQTLQDIDILTVEEKELLLHTFNDTIVEYPADKTIHQLFQDQVEHSAQCIALSYDMDQLSYKELDNQSDHLCCYFLSHGVQPNDIVALMLDSPLEMIVAILGVLKAGAAYLPIDPDYPQDRINYMVKDSAAKMLLNQTQMLSMNRVVDSQFLSGGSRNNGLCLNGVTHVRPTDPAYIIYTSGSTGRPKGVVVEHRGIVNLNVLYHKDFQINNRDRVLQFASFTFDASVSEIFMSLLNGGVIEPVPRKIIRDHRAFENFLNLRCITIATIPPPYLIHLDPDQITLLRILLTAGSETSFDLLEQWCKNAIYINAYGPTEASVCISWWQDSRNEEKPRNLYTSVPIGKPLNNLNLYVLDLRFRLQPLGVAGELCVSGVGLARGYLNRPELTARYFIPNPFSKNQSANSTFSRLYRTGDQCRWFPDGNLEFLGRIDQQVKIRGYRVELGEIENSLLAHELVKEAAVAVREDQSGKDTLSAYIVPCESEIDVTIFNEYLSRLLPQYMVPSFFTILRKLPYTSSGKIDRRALPDPVFLSTEKYIAPRNYIEKTLARIWSDVLGIERNQIGIDDDFFNSGGHSLKAMVLEAKIHRSLNIRIPMTEIFQFPTIRGLAKYIKENTNDIENHHPEIEATELKEYYPLSSAQMRLYILYRWEPDSLNYNIPRVMLLEGDLDRKRLKRVFVQLISRHESFRTVFVEVESQPRQRILSVENTAFEIEMYDVSQLSGEDKKSRTHEIIKKTFIRPFELAQAPLLRVGLVKQSQRQHVLLIDVHHSIADGTSMTVLNQEFAILFDGGSLPELPLQYRDYANWQQRQMAHVIKRQEAFWLDQFEGEIPVLNLPYDYPRPVMQQFEGAFTGLSLTPEETAGLKQLASTHSATLFMTLLAVFNIFLSKLSGQEDIVIGTPVAGRSHADLQHIVGMFINTLTFRNFPEFQKSFEEFLDEVKTRTLSAFDNQDYQFEELVERLAVKRDTSRNPLFDVMFALHNMEVAGGYLPDDVQMTEQLQILPYHFQYNVSKFDITFHGWETQGTVSFNVEYSSRLFKEETIHAFIKYFKKTVAEVLKDPAVALQDIDILDEEQKLAILNFSCGMDYDVDPSMTLHGWFAQQAAKIPDHVAVVSAGQYTQELTYKELNRRADCLARQLSSQGTGLESLVGLMVNRSLELVISMLAVMKSGAAYLAIEQELPDSRKRFILEDGGVDILLTNEDVSTDNQYIPEAVDILDIRFQGLYEDSAFPSNDELPVATGSNLVYVIYTSGSTGKPKGLMIEHGNMVNLFYHMYHSTNIDCSRILQFSTIIFDVAIHETFSALLSGGTICLITREMRGDVAELFRYVENQEVKTIFMPMAFLKMIFSETDYIERFPKCIRHIQTAGEQVVVSTRFAQYLKDHQIHLHNHYGPAETHVITTYTADPSFEIPELPSIGKPLINTGIYIVDARMCLVPRGVPGELCAAGLQVGRGYLNRPDITKEKFIPSPFNAYQSLLYKTGDLARWLSDGNIEFLGRIDTQVKIRGFRIEMGEIETRLLNHSYVKEAVVKAISVGTSGEKRLCAYIVSSVVPDYSEIRQYLGEELPDYMIPAHFVDLKQFPLTPSGKIDRKSLPMPDLEEIEGDEHIEPPNTPLEEQVRDLWSDVLELPPQRIGVLHNFFSLGGQSLKATVLVSKIHKALDIKLPLTDIFKFPTIRGLTALMAEKTKDTFEVIPTAEQRYYYPCSSAQKRLFILQQLDTSQTTYNITSASILEGEIDTTALQNTFIEMIRRHESLRTSFRMVRGIPVQIILDFDAISFSIEFPENVDAFVRPFDLTSPPLLRAGLIRLEQNRQQFMIDMHHIISDGTSMQIFSREFMSLYEGKTLPALHIQYKDFALWQNKFLEGRAGEAQRCYWLHQFKGDIPRLNLPLDYPRPSIQSYEGGIHPFEIGEDLVNECSSITTKENVTMYMIILTFYNLLLARLSGQDDIVVGSVIAGRKHADLNHIMGMFVNTLAIRCFPGYEKSFSGFLNEVKEQVLNSFDNQDYQFEELVESLGVERDASRNPIFTAAIGFHNLDSEANQSVEEAMDTSGSTLDNSATGRKGISKFDITLHVRESNGVLKCSFEYCTRLFKHQTIERFSRYFIQIIKSALENPIGKLHEIDIIPLDEKLMILDSFNQTEVEFPQNKTIHQLFEDQMKRYPDQVSLVSSKNELGYISHLTYSQLGKLADGLAGRLRSMSIGSGDVVALKLTQSIELFIAVLGILKAGAAFLPIDPSYPEERIEYILKDSNARYCIEASFGLSSLEKGMPSREPVGYGQANDAAYIIYTSGTTGRPKGVMVEHRSLVNLCTWHIRYYSVTHRDRASKYAGTGFDASVWEMFPYLVKGASLFIVDEKVRLDMVALNDYFEKKHITIAFLPTPICEQFMRLENWSLRALLTGGDRLRWFKPHHYALYNNYGPTEYTVVSTSYPVTHEVSTIPIGTPIDNSRVLIIDIYEKMQPIGVAGELCVGGAGLARGYLNNPELTAQKFVTLDNIHAESFSLQESAYTVYKTGDLARWLSNGSIEFLGRSDDQVKIRGYRIELKEIESTVKKHPGIAETVVMAREKKPGTLSESERYLCCYWTEVDSGSGLDKNKIMTYLAEVLPSYMIPSIYIKVEQMPLTANQKIDKKKLLKIGEEEFDGMREQVVPASKLEKQIAAIWKEVLAVEHIGLHDNYFDIGGNSLNVITLANELRQELEQPIEVMKLFQHTTIYSFARYINEGEESGRVISKTRGDAIARGKNDKRMRQMKSRDRRERRKRGKEN